MSVSDNDLACICEIRPDIDNDILKILGDFVWIWQRLMAQIFLKRVRIWQRHFGWLSGVLLRLTAMHCLTWSLQVHTMTLPNSILVRILESLYADLLESKCIDISKHHCSLLYPCISISKSTIFKPIYTYHLISSNCNKVFLSTAKLDRYGSIYEET